MNVRGLAPQLVVNRSISAHRSGKVGQIRLVQIVIHDRLPLSFQLLQTLTNHETEENQTWSDLLRRLIKVRVRWCELVELSLVPVTHLTTSTNYEQFY